MQKVRRLSVVVAMVAAILVMASSPAQADSVQYGVKLAVWSSGSCAVAPSSTTGIWVQLMRCDAPTQWDVMFQSNGAVALRMSATNQCLTTPTWKQEYAILYPCQGNADQLFWPQISGGPRPTYVAVFRSVNASGKCLTGPSWAAGGVLLYPCNGALDQLWGVLA